MKPFRIFRLYGGKTPCAPERNALIHTSDEARPVSDKESYVAERMRLAIAKLTPFVESPLCPQCKSNAITTEYGEQWYVPPNPDEPQRISMYNFGPKGTYHIGPRYLVRSCENCKFTWAHHAAEEVES